MATIHSGGPRAREVAVARRDVRECTPRASQTRQRSVYATRFRPPPGQNARRSGWRRRIREVLGRESSQCLSHSCVDRSRRGVHAPLHCVTSLRCAWPAFAHVARSRTEDLPNASSPCRPPRVLVSTSLAVLDLCTARRLSDARDLHSRTSRPDKLSLPSTECIVATPTGSNTNLGARGSSLALVLFSHTCVLTERDSPVLLFCILVHTPPSPLLHSLAPELCTCWRRTGTHTRTDLETQPTRECRLCANL